MSCNPGVCLTPGQVAEGSSSPPFKDVLSNTMSAGMLFYTPAVPHILAYSWLMSKKRVLTAQSTPDTDEDWKRVIGNIYLNLPRLYNIYKKERYDNEGNLNEDFRIILRCSQIVTYRGR